MKKAKNLFDLGVGFAGDRWASSLDPLKAVAKGDPDSEDVITMHTSDLRAAVCIAKRGGARHEFLKGVLLERSPISALEAQAETLPEDSLERALLEGIIHARIIQAAASSGASEKYRG